MILREITVKGLKCFRNECTVGRFDDGLNMIFGPNETGKSTLIEATARALFDDYSSKGESIKQLRPWGTSLAPEIVLEFVADGGEYRLTKRLLADAVCSLQRGEAGGWSGLHERDAADEFVRRILHGESAHGASDLRHWGLARTLWCLRDPCMIGRADDASCVVPSVVAAQIRSVLGEGTVATALDEVRARLDARYGEHFTARRGDPKAGSPIEMLREEIAELERRQIDAEAALHEVEEAGSRLEGIESDLASLEEERRRHREQIDAHHGEVEELEALQRQIERIEEKLARARSDHEEKSNDLERCAGARQVVEATREHLDEAESALEDLQAELSAAQQLIEEAVREHEEAQESRRRAAEAGERGRRCVDALSLLERRQTLNELMAEIEGLREQQETLQERLQVAPHPADEEIKRADTLEREIDRLQTQLEAAGLSVTIEAHREQEIALSGGEEELRETIDASGEVAYTAGASLTIDLPEVARILVRSGASEPAELESALRRSREELREALAPWGVDDSAMLQDLQRDYEQLSEELGRHAERMRRAADPFGSSEEVREQQFQTRQDLVKRLNELKLSEEELAELDRPDLDALEEQSNSAQAREDRLQQTLNQRRERAAQFGERREKLRDEHSVFDATIRKNEAVMTGLLERYNCDEEDALRALVDEAHEEVEELDTTLERERRRLPSDETDPRRLIETSRQALEQVDRRKEELLDRRGAVRGIIERARTEGRYEQLAEIEERLATARRALHEVWREAQAVKLLREIVERRRHGATSGALPGLEQKVSRMLRHITGRDRVLQMSEEMVVTGLVDGEIEHDPKSLSSGTREQLDLVTRLALGETYAEAAGRTMMVLDDALLYTDPRRHDRIKQLLQRAGELLQIFILTSHPERYRGIVPAEYQFDLEAIRADGG